MEALGTWDKHGGPAAAGPPGIGFGIGFGQPGRQGQQLRQTSHAWNKHRGWMDGWMKLRRTAFAIGPFHHPLASAKASSPEYHHLLLLQCKHPANYMVF
jgi:hypothetical protein